MGNLQPMAVQDFPEDDEFAPIPAGWYHAMIDEASVEPKGGDVGDMIKLKLVVNPEEHPEVGKRSVFTNLCYQHSKETPRKIAQRQLGAICRSIGLEGTLEDTEQLIGAELLVKVKVKPETPQFPAGNDVVAFKAIGEEEPTRAAQEPAQAPAPAPAPQAAPAKKAAPAKPAGRTRPSWA